MMVQGSINLSNNSDMINSLNVFPVPDGDTGTNMSLTMNVAVEGLTEGIETVEEVATLVTRGSLMGARGNSGVILSQIFRGFSKGCKKKKDLTVKQFAKALKEASEAAYSAVLKPVEGTILTVIRETADYARSLAKAKVDFNEFFEGIIRKGNESLNNTPNLLPVLKKAGVVDSGGKGLMIFLEGMQSCLSGTTIQLSPSVQKNISSDFHSDFHTEDITFGFCTEFIIQGDNMQSKKLKEKLEVMGDSFVFVEDFDLIKIHIHTDNPGEALEHALKTGNVIKIKIENMREQHSELTSGMHRQAEMNKEVVESKQDFHNPEDYLYDMPGDDEYAFVAVAAGSGFISILTDLGVDSVIEGGQTMNPSTQDFLDRINGINASHIVLFPNNGNVIMAANQAAELSEKDVRVIPTRSIPECISAIIAFENEIDIDQNLENMQASISDVSTISITYANRSTEMDGLDIKENNYISVLGGSLASTGEDITEVAFSAVQKAIETDSELITIYRGEKSTDEQVEAIEERILQQYPDIELSVYSGDQPIYYYIISVE